MDRLRDMQVFVRVVETGGVSAAAADLALAKSAVSRRLRELEAAAGAALFHRATKRLELTAAGEQLYRRCGQILQDVEEALAATADEAASLSGTIRLSAPVSFGMHHLGDALAGFTTAHPAIRFEITLDDRRINLLERNIDVALRIGRLTQADLVARRLTRIRHVICASPDYWLRHGRPATIDDLRDHAFLRYSNLERSEILTFLGPDGQGGRVRREAELRVTLTADNGDLLRALAVRGLGVVVEPTFIVGDAIRAGLLEPVLGEQFWSETDLHAVYLPTRHLSRRVRALIDHLVDHFAGPPAWDTDIP